MSSQQSCSDIQDAGAAITLKQEALQEPEEQPVTSGKILVSYQYRCAQLKLWYIIAGHVRCHRVWTTDRIVE